MINPHLPVARGLRAAVVGMSVAMLAVLAHVIANGMAPPILAVALVALTAGGVALAVSGRRISSTTLVVLIGSAQVGVHLLGSYLNGPLHHVPPSMDSHLMFAAHAGSTALTAIVLGYGERMWWQLSAWLNPWRFAGLSDQHPVERIVQLVVQRLDGFGPVDIRFSVGRRGPPAFTQF